MDDRTFPQPTAEVIRTLIELARHQDHDSVAGLLERSRARFEQTGYDNWNGGTYSWTLILEAPVAVFAALESRLSKIESDISAKLGRIVRQYPNHNIEGVTISLLPPGETVAEGKDDMSPAQLRRIWLEGRFRLFLSHVSAHKVAVAHLKQESALRGVAGFVAHEDISPSLEWQHEIEHALRSMHALVALITPDFHASNWTDQEVGWALGRGILVIPVRLGAVPYGFIGKVQALQGRLDTPSALAQRIVDQLAENPRTRAEMRHAILASFCAASSFAMAKVLKPMVVRIADVTDGERQALWRACSENSEVADAFGVPDAIYGAFGRPAPPRVTDPDDIPF